MSSRHFTRTAALAGALAAIGCSGSTTGGDTGAVSDASGDAQSDAAAADSGPSDAGVSDSGPRDADAADGGQSDGGQPDGSLVDSGRTDAGPFRVDDTDLRREPLRPGADPRVVFRYRSYVGARPAWVSAGSTALVHALAASVSSIDRGGDGLEPLLVTRFDGVGDGYLGATQISTQPVGYTVQAWFRPATTSGQRTLFSNADGANGFSLKIIDGKLTALVRVRDGGATLTYQLSDTVDLDIDRWHAVAMQVSVIGVDVRLRLYVDQRLAVSRTWEVRDGLADSASRPAVGAEAVSGSLDSDFFSGDLHAVEVRNWPVDHDILITPVMGDGATYLGRPGYHDYLSATRDLYLRMESTDRALPDMDAIRVRFQTPLSNDNLIPQGLALAPDGKRLFLVFYWRNLLSGNPDRYPTTVAEFDLEAQQVSRIYRLLNAGGGPVIVHAGGLGFFAGHLYVPSGQRVTRYRIADAVEVVAAVPGRAPAISQLRMADSFATASRGSFLDIDVDGLDLYVGDFSQTGTAPIFRYDLAPDGALVNPSTTESDSRWTLPIPKVQGAVWTGDHFLLSTSWGNSPSHIWRWTPGGSATELFELAAGTEDLDLGPDGTLWTWSESIGHFYQKRASNPWSTLAPWVMGFQVSL